MGKETRREGKKRNRSEILVQLNLWAAANGIMHHLSLLLLPSTEDCTRTGPRHSAKPRRDSLKKSSRGESWRIRQSSPWNVDSVDFRVD